jgi:uncharacterized membrane protein YcjF (UPF0283 family)
MCKIRVPRKRVTHEEVVRKIGNLETSVERVMLDNSSIKLALFGDGNGNKGVVRKIDLLVSNKWSRTDKIAVIAILVTVLGTPLGVGVYKVWDYVESMQKLQNDFHTLQQEFEQIHKSELPDKKSLDTNHPRIYARSNEIQISGGTFLQ